MSRRLIQTITHRKHIAKLYYASDLREYQVRFFYDGVLARDADYHTNDKADAIDTANAELVRMAGIEDTLKL